MSTLPESILEPSGQSLHVPHTSGSDSSSALGLLAPIEVSHLLCGVSAAGACLLLDVVRRFSATTASRVGLIVPFSE